MSPARRGGAFIHPYRENSMNSSVSEPATISPALDAAFSHQACNLCGSSDSVLIAKRDRDRRPLRTVACTRCGLVRADPIPDKASICAYYANEYRLRYKGCWSPKPKHIYRAGQVALGRWRRLRDVLGSRSRILDVGASSGEFVHLLRETGRQPCGIEPNKAYSAWARDVLKLPVITGEWDRAEFARGEFEAVTLFHVLEHLADPRGALTRLAGWLAPDGLLVVEVPNVESRCGALSRRFHFAHLHNFNLPTLQATGEAAGLRVVLAFASEDEGNITVVFTPDPARRAAPCTGLPGNAERVRSALAAQSELGYLIEPRTWVRLGHRLARMVREYAIVRRIKDPRNLLAAGLETAA